MCLYKGMLGINLILSIETFGRIEIDLNLTDKKIINVLSLIHRAEHPLISEEICKQIIKYNRWQQRNGPNIHDVTCVKYSKEDNIS